MLAHRPRTTSPFYPRRGDAAKVVLITLLVVFLVMAAACGGLGIAGYFWFQANLGQMMVSDPVEIRQLTSELADITIPAEFVPYSAHKVFGMTSVVYHWCPNGDCPTLASRLNADPAQEWSPADDVYSLTLSSAPPADSDDAEDSEFWESQFTDEVLEHQYETYTKQRMEVVIKGESCRFYVIKGQQKSFDEQFEDDPDEDMDEVSEAMSEEATANDPAAPSADPATEPVSADPAAATTPTADPNTPHPVADPAIAEPAQPAPAPAPKKEGPHVVVVDGSFPGKQGKVLLRYVVAPENHDDTRLLKMLMSIK